MTQNFPWVMAGNLWMIACFGSKARTGSQSSMTGQSQEDKKEEINHGI